MTKATGHAKQLAWIHVNDGEVTDLAPLSELLAEATVPFDFDVQVLRVAGEGVIRMPPLADLPGCLAKGRVARRRDHHGAPHGETVSGGVDHLGQRSNGRPAGHGENKADKNPS